MFAQKLIKNPVFLLGCLMLYISLNQMNEKGFFGNRREKMMATSCKSVLVMLQKRSPESWNSFCEEKQQNLAVEINSNIKMEKDAWDKHRAAVYRELANNLVFIAKNSLNESLERTPVVRVKFETDYLIVNALSNGNSISKLATLKNQKFVAEHIHKSVRIREKKKDK